MKSRKNNTDVRTVGFKSGERNIFFHILTACNLSCKHCYINPAQHGNITLEKKTIICWLDQFVEPGKQSNLILLGGEPTLHPDLPEIVKYAKGRGLSVTIDSNGYLNNDLLSNISPVELDYLSFSLDGPNPEINDAIRGDNVFEICTENIRKAVKKGFRVSLIYTVSGWNINYLAKMVPLLIDLDVKRFFIQVIGLRGKSAKVDEDDFQVSRKRWLEVVPEVAREAASHGVHVTFPKVFLEENEKFECAGNVAENYFIFPNGRVYQCPLCEDYPIHSYQMLDDVLTMRSSLSERNFFDLQIPEGCVMNKLLQSDNTQSKDKIKNKISCCMLKQEIRP